MKYFTKCSDLNSLKKEYKRLAFKFHSDRVGGDDSIMKEINVEYEKMFNLLKNKSDKKDSTNETSTDFINIINSLMKFDSLTIEVIGTWLWLSGNTYPIKEELKNIGCRYSKGKKMWYWTSEGYCKGYKKKNDINTLRTKYGSTVVKEGTQTTFKAIG